MPRQEANQSYSLFCERFSSDFRFQYPVCTSPPGPPQYSFEILPPGSETRHFNGVSGAIARLKDRDLFRLSFGDFSIARDRVTFTPHQDHPDIARHQGIIDGHFFGIVASWRLELTGCLALHASVVQSNNRAIAMVADKGGGKSTLATYLLSRGFELLSDDMLIARASNDGRIEALPGIPQIRSFPEALDRLVDPGIHRHAVGSYTTKQWIHAGTAGLDRFCSRPTPLGAIYVLERADVQGPVASPLAGTMGFTRLMEFSYHANLLSYLDKSESRDRFIKLADLTHRVPVIHLSIPNDLEALSEVTEAIEAQIE